MNSQDIEVAIKVLQERQNTQDRRLSDVDECCGKLKGTLNSEMRITNERIVKIERGMDINCKDVELEIESIKEKVATQFHNTKELKEMHHDDETRVTSQIDALEEKLDEKISKITHYYITFTLGFFASLLISLVALLK